ncbi:MAG: bifunctional (p)ppGpp synthetase/guanosine-3',5'-bis(diphosphate) 3'-pyrophosphohydrolase [Pseudomonadota bacterium]
MARAADAITLADSCHSFAVARANTVERPDIAREIDVTTALMAKLVDDPMLHGAAALSPIVRDEIVTTTDIKTEFGADVAAFCEQLLRLQKLTQTHSLDLSGRSQPEQAEPLRRLLLAVVSDVRLVLIVLCEKVHAMRAARDLDHDERQRIAIETQNLYAPLANRLGVWQLKWELEDLSFRFLQPDDYRAVAKALKARRADREAYLEQVKTELGNALRDVGIEATISSRPKHIYSIYRKIKRKGSSIESLSDLRAVRLLVDDVQTCYAALGVVHQLWSYLPQEFDDYIANPKANAYQSLHTAVIGPHQLTLEVQIRTHDMHTHAELGVAAHWRYKEGGASQPAFEQKIRWLRQLLEPSGERDSEFLEQVREDILEDRVYAISPKGDIVDLPAGATPLDFAYQVHTEVGHRCRGATVDGRIVPLTYRIENGDHIEIITGRESSPSRDWLVPQLGFVASARSRTKIRSWFRQLDRDQHLKQGRDALDRELARLAERSVDTQALAAQLKFADVETLCIALGAGDLAPAAIATALQHLRAVEVQDDALPRRRRRRSESSKANAVLGVGDLMSQFARCCRPLPPDPIVGYITQGRGISIHRADCGNLRRLVADNPDRVLEVSWGGAEQRYVSDVSVLAQDRPGLLRDVGGVFADADISVLRCDSQSLPGRGEAQLRLTVEVGGLADLSDALTRLAALPYVVAAKRVH